jgi:transcriptional regulator with XRE-family HTH domain
MGRTPGDVFRARLTEARKARGWSKAALARRLEEIGHPLHETAIVRIESGKRGVTLDDSVAIAAALDVAPIHLWLPIDGDEPIALTPALEVDIEHAREWAQGRRPLDQADSRYYAYQSPLERVTQSWTLTTGAGQTREED